MRSTGHTSPSESFLRTHPSDARSLASWMVGAALLAYLIGVKLTLTVLPGMFRSPSQAAVFQWPFLAMWAAAGWLGIVLAARTGFPVAWADGSTNRRRLRVAALWGLVFGVAAIATDMATGWTNVAARELNIPSIHIEGPASLLIYPGGAIIVEIVYRLLPIPLLLWIVSNGLLRGRFQTPLFWTLALLTSLVEPAGDLGLNRHGTGMMLAVAGQDFALNFVQAWMFRRHGFAASIAMRTVFYLVWHVLWGAML